MDMEMIHEDVVWELVVLVLVSRKGS